MKSKLFLCGLLALAIPTFAKSHHDDESGAKNFRAPKDAVILIIRHAEKPDNGYGLSPAGEQRAATYANYFKKFTLDGQPLQFDSIFAAADSKESHRPRLTIEPTSRALSLAIDSRFKDKDFQELADAIKSKPHDKHILICWHHGEIPQLVQALGADSSQLFSKAKWPEAVFNWVVELRYDADGRLVETKRIDEKF